MTNENDYRTAVHEAGHFIAASFYRIPARPEITPDGESRLAPEISSPANAGVCHTSKPFSRYQYSVVCWSGILAECLCGIPPFWAPPFPPSARMLADWHLMVLNQCEKLSRGDQLWIFGACDTGDPKKFKPGDSWRACKMAFQILRKNRARIARLAKSLVEAKAKADRAADERKWADVTRPSRYPATHADFLNLICGNDTERFDQFLVSRAALHLTNNRTSKIEDAKLALGELFDDAYVISANFQRSIFAGDFPTADAWLAAAQAFRQWEKETQ